MARARKEIAALRAHLETTGADNVAPTALPSHFPFLHSLLCAAFSRSLC